MADQNTEEIDKHELMAKYDKESAFRTNLGPWGWITLIIGAALTIFQLYTAFYGSKVSLIQGAIHLGAGLSLVYLLYPIKPSMTKRRGVPWYDALLAIAALLSNYYIIYNYDHLINEAIIFGFTALDQIVATAGIILLLEATRRVVGLPIVIIAILALLYGLFGQYIPIIGHAGYDWPSLATEMFFSSSSIFGIPIQISSTYIYLFLFFGVILVKTNIGQFFNDIALRLTGKYTGGTAKAAVAASGLQGMVSGSSVANTVGSGSFTIPMMKNAGFKPHFAAATEAAASTGGQIMPPIMGAAAFIMASYTGVPYNEIILIAIIPAVLYFSGLFMGTHFEARKQGILGLAKEQLPNTKNLIKRLDLFAPLVIIVGFLLAGYTPTFAALFAIFVAFIISFFRKDTRMSFKGIVNLLEEGARTALPVIAACATAGIIAGTVTTTGLGPKIAGGIIDLAQGQFFLVMVFTMVACIILGMGLPTTANYVVTATMAAPALLAFDVPVIAVHMFVFYFGIVADITPPVCLAAYAGAGIAKANPMKAGVTAVKLAIAAFIIPYMFVSQPILLLQADANVTNVSIAVITAMLGMAAISSSLIGYYVNTLNRIERIVLIIGGLLLVYPDIKFSLVGLVVFGVITTIQFLQSKSDKKKQQTS
ncbi:TRAP transporter, 4TM/12TM fusion protein [Virgibacillus subterraneus]|uniref:TRAP transporter, 4TM/12TM fusion protein n=2 Tax=Virgibacillus TaxID=84406 RepID=A0A1H1FW62_9BACI|nr:MULTISPECIES: TRAP transporter permease [Virgibacillus]SDR05155.1 TRAP transporter, 4TM/12TM fusion protein [Virgibacillus salinus]SEQ76127.1 TRAP transporter, 4TM/12TM fusion protein [Virgibacillus subterraneus]